MRKKSFLFGLAGIVLLSGAAALRAEDNPKAAAIKQLFELGEGCKAVLDPATREIKGIVVIGSAPISKSYTAAEALKKARRDALVDAQKNFSKYLNTSVNTSFDEKTREVRLVEGSSGGEEQGSSTEKVAKLTENQELFKSVSQSVQSGMEKEGEKREEGMLVAVYSWEPAKCAALKSAAKTMGDTANEAVKQANRVERTRVEKTAAKDEPATDKKSGGSDGAKAAPAAPGKNAPVSDKTIVAPDASKVF